MLAWILGEQAGVEVRRLLAGATRVVSSTLTTVECARALARGVATGRLTEQDELASLRLLDQAAAGWVTLDLGSPVLDRAGARFPVEPVRTLDALHLATAVHFHQALGPITVATLDDRLRENARGLGLDVAPSMS